jgi:signal transduction histidine kinase
MVRFWRCRRSFSLGHASVVGNPDLVERMVANLVDNAIRHNVPGGRLDLVTETRNQHSVLTVSNTGPLVPEDQAERLFQPFQRLGGERATHPDGHGLGLSIVRAIATTHDAGLKVQLRPGGGLHVQCTSQRRDRARTATATAACRPVRKTGRVRR